MANDRLIVACRDKVLNGELLGRDEISALTAVPDKEALYAAANAIRERFTGKRMDLCTIMNARSGRCNEDCKWCAQSRRHKTGVAVYDLVSPEASIAQARINETAGAHRFSFVTSGKNLPQPYLDKLCALYRQIGAETGLTLCASMGLLTKTQLRQLADSGVKHYHCNIETAPSFFGALCSTHTIGQKIATLKAAREAGMGLCSGGIIGMGESMEQRAEMIMVLQELAVESIPVNILNPIPGTPLENTPPLSDEEILTSIAVFRFACPGAWIRFAGGRKLIRHIQDKALLAGINASLIGDLLTTVGSGMKEDIDFFHGMNYEC